MKMTVLALILLSLVGVRGSVLIGEPKAESPEPCSEALAKENTTRQAFAMAVAHGVHSLYLEPLRYPFADFHLKYNSY
jgi:hypothetical protein